MSPGLVRTIQVGFVADLFVWLADVSVKGVIVLGVALLFHRVLRGAEARVRHALWGAAFLGILFMPLVCHLTPAWRVGLWPSLSTFGLMEPMAVDSLGGSGGSPQSAAIEPGTFAQGLPQLRWPWFELMLGVWAVGVTIILGRLMFGLVRTEQIVRRGTPLRDSRWHDVITQLQLEDHLAPRVRTLEHRDVCVPFTYGFFRPVILLPARVECWSSERRRLVLLHESSHINRNDWLIQILAHLACAVYWFNPLVWMAARHLHAEQEHACDARIVLLGVRPSEYAAHLLEIARSMIPSATLPVASVTLTHRNILEQRLRSILRPGSYERRAVALLPIVPSVVATVVLVVSALAPEGEWKYDSAERISLYSTGLSGPWGDRRSLVPDLPAEISSSISRSIANSIARSVALGVSAPPDMNGNPLDRAHERARKREEDRVRRRVEDRIRRRAEDRARRSGNLDLGSYIEESIAAETAADASVTF